MYRTETRGYKLFGRTLKSRPVLSNRLFDSYVEYRQHLRRRIFQLHLKQGTYNFFSKDKKKST